MFNLKNKKSVEIEESYKYTANALSDVITKQGKNVIAITSGRFNEAYRTISEKIFEEMNSDDTKLLLIDARIDESKEESISPLTDNGAKSKLNLVNVSKKSFKKIICENENKYDVILVIIPPVILKADALEYAKVCKNVILIEKYMYSGYENYENSLLQLRNSGTNIEGVIVCR